MRIALTCPASLPATQFGGILFLSLHMARKLAKQGHDVTIFTSNLDFANNASTFNKNLPKTEHIDGFTIKRSNVWFSFYLFFVNPGIYFQMLNQEFDLIHSFGVRSFQALAAAWISKRKKIPLIISDQGGLTTHPDLKYASFFKKLLIRLQEPAIKFIIKQATAIIVPNEYEKNIFEKYSNEKKIKIIKNGIDLGELTVKDFKFKECYNIKNNFILFLGRFHKVKGIDILLKALYRIKNHSLLENIILVIMGVDFGFEKQMHNLVKSLSLSERVKIIKNPPREHVLGAYSECEFLVLPSRWELSPLTPLEGFAFKKAVISSTAHGIPSTITNNVNAILIDIDDTRGLAEAILSLLKDENKRKKLGEAGYEYVTTVANSDTMVNSIFEIYTKVINTTKRR